jgi:hypothetical protein
MALCMEDEQLKSNETMLRVYVAAAGLRSLNDLCRRSGVYKNTLHAALHGTRPTRASTVARLARALKIEDALVRDLFPGARTQ